MIIREASREDLKTIKALLPYLVAFTVPEDRDSEDFWMSDYDLYQKIVEGSYKDGFALVVEVSNQVLATALVSFRDEILSGEPSSHLEVIVVHPDYHGTGIAQSLLEVCENKAKEGGAHCMTLHAYHKNMRARSFYEKLNYRGEFLRYRKVLQDSKASMLTQRKTS